MVFNLSQQRHFPLSQQAQVAIRCASNYGPCFTGGGANELSACNEPFRAENNCRSVANQSGYKIAM